MDAGNMRYADRMGLTFFLVLALTALFIQDAAGQCNGVTQFTCTYQNSCIPIIQRNNGVNDCFDNSDEVSPPCQKDLQFICGSGTCIPLTYKDDGDKDCADGADEQKTIGYACSLDPSRCCPCTDYVPNSFCDSTSNTCQCNLGYYASPLKNNCIKRTLNDACVTDVDCSAAVDYTTCSSGKCACQLGYYADDSNSYCIQRVLGDNCTTDSECSAVMEGAECSNLKCICNSNWFEFSNRTGCWHRVLGDACSTNSHCLAGINNAVCDPSNVCACAAGWVPKEGTDDTCRKRILGSDTCSSNADCSSGIPNSSCISGFCQCDVTYYENAIKTACLLRKIYDSCSSTSQCGGVANTVCGTASVCQCLSGYLASVSLLVCDPYRVGHACNATSECLVALPNSKCVSGKCACRTGFLTDTDKTCRRRQIGVDSCSGEADCTGSISNSNCTSGKCACNEGYETRSNPSSTCFLITIKTTSCSTNSECSRFPNSVCGSGKCTCLPAYIDENIRCTRRVIGSDCSTDAECEAAVLNSTCNGTSCVCAEELYPYVWSSTSCRRRVLGVDSCTLDSECRGGIANSLCAANKTCLCGPGYEATDDRYLCLSTGASTGDTECTDFASCKPWAIALIIVLLLLPPIITGVVMVTYKNIQDRKKRLSKKGFKKGRTDLYRDLGMGGIRTITNFTAPHDTALHTLPEIGADWSITNDDTYFTSTPKGAAGLVIRDKSFFRDITSITSKVGSMDDGLVMSKVDI